MSFKTGCVSSPRLTRTCGCWAPARGRRTTSRPPSTPRSPPMPEPMADIADKIFSGTENLDDFLRGLDRLTRGLPARIDADPKTVEQGLAKLVLTLINLLRQLMERQAIRRMEGGSLSDEEV